MNPDAPTEADSERDGLLSYSKEWHALAIGLAAGIVAAATGQWYLAVAVLAIAFGLRAARGPLKQLRKEPWYLSGGVVGGYVLVEAAVIAGRIV